MKEPTLKFENIKKVERNEEYYLKLAEKLEGMNESVNQGRGSDHIRGVISFLKRGDIDKAKADCFQQRDKYTWIQDIKEVIINELFEEGERHPWTPIDIHEFDILEDDDESDD